MTTSDNLENNKEKWCAYRRSNGHSKEDCYQQESETKSKNLDNSIKLWRNDHITGSHSDDECPHQKRDGKRKERSTAGSSSKKHETSIAENTAA